jgi:hypothetical protein
VVDVRDDHPLAARSSVALERVAGETVLVAERPESGRVTARVLSCARRAASSAGGAAVGGTARGAG